MFLHRLFNNAAHFREITRKWALPVGRAIMLTRAFSLCFIHENHFMNGFAASDGRIKCTHGSLHSMVERANKNLTFSIGIEIGFC